MVKRFYPTADGTFVVSWTASAGTRWSCVDDDPHNSDVDYITCVAAPGAYYSAICPFTFLTGALIQKVEVVLEARDQGAPHPTLFADVWIGAVNSESASWILTAAYVETKKDFTAARPGGGSWTAADFLGGTFNFGCKRDNIPGSTPTRVSGLYLDITCEFPGGFMSLVD